MAVVTGRPATLPAPRRGGAPGGGLRSRLASTPGRLSVWMVALLVLGLAAGLAAVIGVQQRKSVVDSVRTRSGPLSVSAQQLYRSLSDADATAAAAFLSTGAEPADLRQRYQNDIAAATDALARANPGTVKGQQAVAQLAQSLPVYTGLVETARSYNRLNLPVGAAYLREASHLMRNTLLSAASQLYDEESKSLSQERSDGASGPWFALLLVVALLVALVAVQRGLSRRTHRTFNVGLGAASLATVALLLWLSISWIGVASNLSVARSSGSAQVQVLAQARIAALNARADEALTLVARGGGGDYENEFQKQFAALTSDHGLLAKARKQANDPKVRSALDDLSVGIEAWRKTHAEVRDLDSRGDYPNAVKEALDDKSGTAAAFAKVDADLDKAITATSAAFDKSAGGAQRSLAGSGFGFGVLTVVLLAGVAAGLTQRIAEYR
jgi:hypothetical protein